MPITYDLETDIRFLQGIEKAKMEDVKALILQNILTNQQIVDVIKVPLDVVRRVRKDIENLTTEG